MHSLAKVTLENEMDLVLAHKRCMKLAEIAGLSLSAQTTFATAVSEVSRNTIDHGKNGCLTLGISEGKQRSIIASIKDDNLHDENNKAGLDYAKKLVNRLNVLSHADANTIELYYHVPQGERIDLSKLNEWRSIFRNEAPISPYDEIKRKNEQLQEMAEKLRESEDHYRMLTDTLPLMMFSLDENGNFVYANRWLCDYLGCNVQGLNNPERDTNIFGNDLPYGNLIRKMIEKGEPVKTEWRVKEKESGNYFWHLVSIIPLMNGREKPHNWFGFLVDIHAQKMYEQTLKDNHELKEVQTKLQNNIKELNRSNQELQQFAFVASHDLQEPLRKIMFYSDYIQNKYMSVVDEKSREYLKSMYKASFRMRSLINDLLAFSQVDRKLLKVKQVDLNKVMRQVIENYEMSIKEKGARVIVGPLPVMPGDPTMLRRLFENVLSNALKYTRENIIPEINISAAEKGQMVEITIKDNGIGFEEKLLSKIFTLFQRLHGREKYEGTGLGLAICRKIADMHDGSITATSKVGEGSTFFIYLPVSEVPVASKVD